MAPPKFGCRFAASWTVLHFTCLLGDKPWLTRRSLPTRPVQPSVAARREMGLELSTGRLRGELTDFVGRLLLVIDQCKHLADACAVMTDALLRGCPGLHIIATSRHVLGVAGEITVPVPPMMIPAEGLSAAPEELERYEAVRLFSDRAAVTCPPPVKIRGCLRVFPDAAPAASRHCR